MDKKIVTFSTLGKGGELGNQLFQIASTIAYARRSNRDPIFPKWHCTFSGKSYSQYFDNKISENFNHSIDKEFVEPAFYYSEIPFFDTQVLNLRGYFQTEKYFCDFRDEIIHLFTPVKDILDKINKLAFTDTVGVQLRFYDRGWIDPRQNYYSADENKDFLIKSINFFGKNKTFLVTTNNIIKAKKMLGIYDNFRFIDEEYTSLESLFVLSKCENNIISNSSFGWWSAWLNTYKDKTVFAPKKWFKINDSWHNSKDICPNNWRIL